MRQPLLPRPHLRHMRGGLFHRIPAQGGHDEEGECGGVLLWILVTIALFAALTAVVSRGSRTSETMLTDQQAKLYATEIMQYGNNLAYAVQKLRINGCKETDFDFYNVVWTLHDGTLIHPAGQNPVAVLPDCGVFDPNGGAIRAIRMPLEAIYFPAITSKSTGLGMSRIIRGGVPGIGDEGKEELVYRLPSIRKEVCLKINELLGIQNDGDDAPTVTGAGTTAKYQGNFPENFMMDDISGLVTGKSSFCAISLEGASPDIGPYSYLQVLIVR